MQILSAIFGDGLSGGLDLWVRRFWGNIGLRVRAESMRDGIDDDW